MVNINQSFDTIMTVEGAQCAALVDSGSGMLMGAVGTGVDMEIAAAGNTEVVRSKLKSMRALSLNDSIEDILISLGKAYHIMRPVATKPGLFFYVVLDRNKSNLALARRKVADVEGKMTM